MVYFVESGLSSNSITVAVAGCECKKMKVYRYM